MILTRIGSPKMLHAQCHITKFHRDVNRCLHIILQSRSGFALCSHSVLFCMNFLLLAKWDSVKMPNLFMLLSGTCSSRSSQRPCDSSSRKNLGGKGRGHFA